MFLEGLFYGLYNVKRELWFYSVNGPIFRQGQEFQPPGTDQVIWDEEFHEEGWSENYMTLFGKELLLTHIDFFKIDKMIITHGVSIIVPNDLAGFDIDNCGMYIVKVDQVDIDYTTIIE